MRRLLPFLAVLLATLTLTALPALAQLPEPTKSIEAAFQDINRRTGQNYTRDVFPGTWRWAFTDAIGANLGCPEADPNGPRASGAYVITITVRRVGVFEYRATRDEAVFITCRFPEIVLPTPTPLPSPTFVASPLPAATPTLPAPAQVDQKAQAAAFIGTDGNVYVTSGLTADGATALTNDAGRSVVAQSPFYTSALDYSGLRWSPDGNGLLWMESTTNALYLAVSGQSPRRVISGLAPAFPAAWSPDGTEVAYVVATTQSVPIDPNDGAKFIYQVQAVSTLGGGPRVAGSFNHIEGCGGFNPDPADILYDRETRSFGGNEAVLFWLPTGFLHTTNCGNLGLAFTDFSGKEVWALENVGRVAIAPDGTRAVAIRFQSGDPTARTLILIDLSNGETSPLETQAGPERAVWAGNGTAILYSTIQLANTVEGSPSVTAGQEIFGVWPLSGSTYTVTIYGVAAGGGRSVSLFSEAGRGVAALSVNDATNNFAFCLVTGSAPLIEALNKGTTGAALADFYPKVSCGLSQLPLSAILDPNPSATGSGGGFVQGGGWAFSGRPFGAAAAQ